MPIQSAALELLVALAPVASRWGRWYVFGAQAVILYGVPRLSADVDVTLALEPDAPDRFAVDMAAAGFSLRVDDPDFVRRTRVMPFIHTSTGMPVDIVLAGSGLEDEFLARARQTDVYGTMLPVIDLADLIIAKVLAGRSKDIDDARALWKLHGRTVDADRIRHTLRLLEEALAQGDCGTPQLRTTPPMKIWHDGNERRVVTSTASLPRASAKSSETVAVASMSIESRGPRLEEPGTNAGCLNAEACRLQPLTRGPSRSRSDRRHCRT